MKTPTIIVRFFALYILVNCVITLIQLHRVQSAGPVSASQATTFSDLQTYSIIGVVVGLAGTVFAGFFARLLTFDSERSGRHDQPDTRSR
jgi:hypothetical protein